MHPHQPVSLSDQAKSSPGIFYVEGMMIVRLRIKFGDGHVDEKMVCVNFPPVAPTPVC